MPATPQQGIIAPIVSNQSLVHTRVRRGHIRGSIFFVGLAILQVSLIALAGNAEAGFASQLSLSLREEFNDSIFFSEKKESDFVTSIIPTISLFYMPTGQTIPVFTASLAPEAQIYARHPEETNFADNVSLNARYTYYHSPRLTIDVSNTLSRLGTTRTGEFGGLGASTPPTVLPPPGSTGTQPSSQKLVDNISNDQQLSNQLSVRGAYTFDPNLNVVGDYGLGFKRYLDLSGTEVSHKIGARGVYKWKEEHNLHLGYGIEVINSRNGSSNVVHNIDAGDDYFSNLQIQLTPTLTITALSGIALNAGGNGSSSANSRKKANSFQITNRSNITVTKLWERATVSLGFNKGFTPSFGVSGISDTTSFFANASARLTELLAATAKLDYSLFDTEDVKFSALIGSAGLQYRINRWLSSSVEYTHRSRDAGSGAASTGVLTSGKISSNSVSIVFRAHFDLWPNLGLGQQP